MLEKFRGLSHDANLLSFFIIIIIIIIIAITMICAVGLRRHTALQPRHFTKLMICHIPLLYLALSLGQSIPLRTWVEIAEYFPPPERRLSTRDLRHS